MKKTNLYILLVLIGLNLISAFFYFRIDLSEDKHNSISEASKKTIKGLKSQVVVKVYLEGNDLPGGFQRLRKNVEETLSEFKNINRSDVDYQFIDPLNGTDSEQKERFKELTDKGMQPTNIFDNKGGQKTQSTVFPYASIQQDGKESIVLLLKGNLAESAQNRLNQSAEIIEHTLISAIKKLDQKEKKKIALLAEFTPLKPINFGGLITSLQENYQLYILQAAQSPNFDGIDAIILPKPEKPIDEATKIKLDQYLMKGGKILFFVEGLKVDTLGLEGSYAQALNVNLDDMLFRYGLRVNKNIVKDGLNAAVIPMVVGNMGDKPNFQPVPYRYYPLINNFGNSLITKNIDMVMTKYSASIDTVNSGYRLSKTPLLLTSPYTKVLNAPALITFNEAKTDTDPNEYKQGVKALAYLVEGKFKSLFAGRVAGNYVQESVPTKILVCSDGDLVISDIDTETGNPFPVGFDKFSKHQYGNQDFVLNALNYMLDENGIISAKSKSFVLRPLNTIKTRDERFKWQVLNLIVPLLILSIIGIIRFLYLQSKRKPLSF